MRMARHAPFETSLNEFARRPPCWWRLAAESPGSLAIECNDSFVLYREDDAISRLVFCIHASCGCYAQCPRRG